MKDIYRFVRYLPTKHQLWCIDSCFSGELLFKERCGQDLASELIKEQSIIGICSSLKKQTSLEKEGESLFSKALIEVLREFKKASSREDEYMTVYEFFHKVRKKVYKQAKLLNNSTQIPVIGNLKQGNEGTYIFS